MLATVAGATRPALLVVGSPTLGTGDAAVRDRLVALGYTPAIIDDSVVKASSATGQDLVLVSSTVSATTIGTKLTAVTVPLITWEGALYDDLGMTSAPGGAKAASQTALAITNAAHPLSAGA